MKKTIVIDAGHGGNDTGNLGNNIVEKDYVLQISLYIAVRLEELGIPYFLTRIDDRNLSTDERINLINTKFGTNNDLILISNHLNKGNEKGLEIIYSLRNNSNLSKKIAEEVEGLGFSVNKYYQLRDNEDTSKDYYPLLRDTPNYETIMIEYGYVDNKDDVASLKNNYQKYGEGVVKALAEYTGQKYVEPVDKICIVKQGDTLYKIATENKLSVEKLKKYNNLSSNILKIGQVLRIPT